MSQKKKIGYRTIQVPNDLVTQINQEREINNLISYRSHSEFIIDAARRRLEEVRELRLKFQ